MMATMGLLPVAGSTVHAQSQSQAEGSAQTNRPNIIFIMCDDMGYGDLGCYGQQRIETPNLDRMASQGMRFTQAYAGSPVSAPSRASFMTGQHTGHTHVRGNREYWRSSSRANMYGNNADYALIGQEPYLMSHKIIPEVMKEAGYNTGMFGKWAGGYYNTDYPNTYLLDAKGNSDTSKSGRSSSASLPNKRGIDCYYGYICQFQAHTYYPNFLNRYDPEKYGDEHVVVDVLEENIKHKAVSTGDKDFENRSQYTSDLIHQYALEWIDRQAEKDAPFLGIFTYTLPHAELWQPQDSLVAKYKEKFKGQDGGTWGGEFASWYYRAPNRRAQFAAMISRLDAQVGEIFEKLEEKGIADNTLVIFTSDNGPHTEGGADPTWFNSNGGLQGTKRQTHEGGVRVPSKEWILALRKRCTEQGALLIYDEVQCAFGRTGRLWGWQHAGVVPDIMCLAKALGGGMPLGAFVSSAKIMDCLKRNPVLGHITTFGGHPVCCAAGLASFEYLLRNKLHLSAEAKGARFEERLRGLEGLREIRRAGLLLALDWGSAEKCNEVVKKLTDAGMMTESYLFAPESMRISPALTITEEEIDSVCDEFISILSR